MSVRLDGDIVYLEAQCRVEDAEPLSAHLQSGVRRIDVSRCELLHAAVFQALIAFKPTIICPASDTTVANWLATLPTQAEADAKAALHATSLTVLTIENLPPSAAPAAYWPERNT